ncbi:MAG TPA: lysylphosphatidylglycerol synthase domain-containing protein, partial [Rhodothermales bacterium]|nr:lysylphosphatidylglycerol synthase domain-containing protein [Rhodothermales bacterium]
MSLGLAAPLGSGSGRWSFWGRLIVGVGLIGLLLIVVNPIDVIRIGQRIHPGWAAAAIVLSVAWLTLGAFNVWILLRRLAPVAFRDFLRVYLVSWAAALVIPGQLGDATQVMLLRRYEVPMSSSGAAYLVDKFVSLTWLMAVAAVGVSLYLPRFHGWWLVAPPVLILAALWLAHRLFASYQVSESTWLGQGRRV